jgi:hypothetical protein
MSIADVMSGVSPLLRRVRLEWLRRRRRRDRSCLRCGAPAIAVCAACGTRACGRCALPSIETGTHLLLCLGCSRSGSPPRPFRRLRGSPAETFRRGAFALLAVAVAFAGLALQRDGWPGLGRFLLALIHPSLLFALVPLAFVVGAILGAMRRLLR